MRKMTTAVLLAALAAAVGAVPASADDHIMAESRRTYMGRTYPPQMSEIWIGADKVYARDGAVTTIDRYDLGKRWVLNVRTMRYLEEALGAPTGPEAEGGDPARVQELGWSYTPVYVWTGRLTGEEKVVDGRTCVRAILTGIAEYAEETREVWLAKDVPIDVGRYYRRIVQPALTGTLAPVFAKTAALRDRLAVRTVATQEPPIAGRIVWETAMTRIEAATPPAGIYDVPSAFTKAANRDEWLGR
jgi:hypothetical protein